MEYIYYLFILLLSVILLYSLSGCIGETCEDCSDTEIVLNFTDYTYSYSCFECPYEPSHTWKITWTPVVGGMGTGNWFNKKVPWVCSRKSCNFRNGTDFEVSTSFNCRDFDGTWIATV